jgi:hypothetical protein
MATIAKENVASSGLRSGSGRIRFCFTDGRLEQSDSKGMWKWPNLTDKC